LRAEWNAVTESCFAAYEAAWRAWEQIGLDHPELTGIPRALLESEDEKSRRTVERMRRNYAFDRARYYLPASLATNVMLAMSARGWATLCQHLCSHPLPEARALGDAIRGELALCTPRLLKHAGAKASIERGIMLEFEAWRSRAGEGLPPHLRPGAEETACPSTAAVEVLAPEGARGTDFAGALAFHDNRYAWFGSLLRRTAVRFSWQAVALAEIRDLNRHRTGGKYCPQIPLGFYSALDQLPAGLQAERDRLMRLNEAGRAASARARELLAAGDVTYVYWAPLGAQYLFEHVTTADKFIYEAELRTGLGAHFQYARHLREALACWYGTYPETRGLILEGAAEPE
jgi:hypothetical protein